MAFACGSNNGGDSTAEDAGPEAQTEWLFMITAGAATVDAAELLLTRVDPAIFAFTERPDRQHATWSWSDLDNAWSESADSFLADPPNAVIRGTSRENLGMACAMEMELTGAPVHGSDGTRMPVRVLDGWQGRTGECSKLADVTVFVDALSLSACGASMAMLSSGCCGGTALGLLQTCCGGTAIGPDMVCCGGRPVAKIQGAWGERLSPCCNGKVMTEFQHCCGGEAFDVHQPCNR